MRVRSSVDRAPGSGPVGRGFESLRAHQYRYCYRFDARDAL